MKRTKKHEMIVQDIAPYAMKVRSCGEPSQLSGIRMPPRTIIQMQKAK